MLKLISKSFSNFFLISFLLIFSVSCTDDFKEQDKGFIQEEEAIQADSILSQTSNYIVIIGDIQAYTNNDARLKYLNLSCDWIANQQELTPGIISCVLQNGDLTEDNSKSQYKNADEAFSHLGETVILIPSTGNHDYKWGGSAGAMEITDRNSTGINTLNNLNPLRMLPILEFEPGKLDNIIVPIMVGKRKIYIIALEFGPRKEAVDWATLVVKANPDVDFILMTHEWMTRSGLRIDKGSYADAQFPNLSHSTPEEIWQKLVYPNNNILCVLCGHNGFCKYLFSKNKAGREVCQILFNLQYQENGGDGLVQLWEFPKDKNIINVSVYNTITREFHPDSETRMEINL